MSYDLLLHRQTPRNWARENLPEGPRHPVLLAFGVAGIAHLLPHLFKHGETQYYRRKLADDRASITREMPAISMYELAGARKYTRAT
jgi:hypothetical protein